MPRVIIYCDGSCSHKTKDGGYASLVVKEGSNAATLVKGSARNTTNQRMELFAALKALETLTKPHEVDLVSDSAYLINAIKNKWYEGWDSRIKNWDLWERIIAQIKYHEINPVKVVGHSGEVWNTIVDDYAVDARINMLPDTIKEISA